MTERHFSSLTLRQRLMWSATGVFALIALLAGIGWIWFAASIESTDDAYVHGNLVAVSSQIPGTVVAIEADDTQTVAPGAPLIALDRSDASLALSQAEATLAQTVRRTRTLFMQNEALAAEVAVGKAHIEQAQTQLDKARSDWRGRNALRRSGGVSGEELRHAEVAVKSAEAALAQARGGLMAAQAKLAANQTLTQGSTVATHPDVLQAADQVRQAWLVLSRTHIAAPVGGMVVQRSVQLGQRIQPGQPLMTLVPLNSLWVEANFKETQLRAMRPGQPVTLVSDLYGSDTVYHGTVQGVSAGTGSAFALLPAQNASGNWIKVVQRVPVRIQLDPRELEDHPLRVGLSMTARVDLSSAPGPKAQTAAGSAADASLSPVPQHTDVYEHDTADIDHRIRTLIRENLAA